MVDNASSHKNIILLVFSSLFLILDFGLSVLQPSVTEFLMKFIFIIP